MGYTNRAIFRKGRSSDTGMARHQLEYHVAPLKILKRSQLTVIRAFNRSRIDEKPEYALHKNL